MDSKHILMVVAMFAMWAAAERLNGPCPRHHKVMNKVDGLQLSERWFVVKQSNPNNDNSTKCTQAQIDFALPYLNFTLIRFVPSSNQFEKVQGNGLIRENGPAQLKMFIQRKDETLNGVRVEVLDTDYYNFALIYFCHTTGPFSSFQGTYVLSRTASLDNSLYPRMDKVLQENGLSMTSHFVENVQNCGKITCDDKFEFCKKPA